MVLREHICHTLSQTFILAASGMSSSSSPISSWYPTFLFKVIGCWISLACASALALIAFFNEFVSWGCHWLSLCAYFMLFLFCVSPEKMLRHLAAIVDFSTWSRDWLCVTICAYVILWLWSEVQMFLSLSLLAYSILPRLGGVGQHISNTFSV